MKDRTHTAVRVAVQVMLCQGIHVLHGLHYQILLYVYLGTFFFSSVKSSNPINTHP